MVCQRNSQMAFIEFYECLPKEAAQANVLTLQQDEFLKWIKEATILKKLEYIDSVSAEELELEQAQVEVFVDYKNKIMIFC